VIQAAVTEWSHPYEVVEMGDEGLEVASDEDPAP